MRGKFLAFSFLVLALVGFSSGANAADMVPEYLHGNWVIGMTEQKCSEADAEYFVFNQNGTFEAGKSMATSFTLFSSLPAVFFRTFMPN